tara:strand:+ start:1052 stop:1432 length:381 start_codon:yes stop_codon:yes gene_type:complete
MIIQGKKGSLVIFFKDKLIAGYPLGRYNYEDYKNQSNTLIRQSLQDNISIKEQIEKYKYFVELIYNKKINRKKISGYDLQVFCAVIISLIKFKQLEEDDVLFFAPRKKKRGKTFVQDKTQIADILR